MPEFVMEGNGTRAVGRVTYRCGECQEMIADDQLIFVDTPNGYTGTRPPVPFTKTTRTFHLAHIPEVNDGR